MPHSKHWYHKHIMHPAIYHYVDPTDKAFIVFLIFGIGVILFIVFCTAAKGLKLIDKVPTAVNFMLSLVILTPICLIIALTLKAGVISEGKADLHEYLQKNYNIDLSQEQTRQLYNNLGYAEIPVARNGKYIVIKLKQVSPDNYTLYEKTADKPISAAKETEAKPQSTSKPTEESKPQVTPKPSPTPFDIKNLPPLVPTSVPSELTPSGK
jgi:hypothetical protein